MSMPTVDNLFYEEIADALDAQNPIRLHKYFYSQKYLKDEAPTPFDPIAPLTADFYGPKVLTILVVSKPYDFPEEPTSAILNRIIDNYENWDLYEVHIWVDLVLAMRILDASGDDNYYNRMQETATALETICNTTMTDYGFKYKGTLSDGKDAAFFQTYIDEFYARP